jgi:hypothetical protein
MLQLFLKVGDIGAEPTVELTVGAFQVGSFGILVLAVKYDLASVIICQFNPPPGPGGVMMLNGERLYRHGPDWFHLSRENTGQDQGNADPCHPVPRRHNPSIPGK